MWKIGGKLVKKHLGATTFLIELESGSKSIFPTVTSDALIKKAIWFLKAHSTVILPFDFAKH